APSGTLQAPQPEGRQRQQPDHGDQRRHRFDHLDTSLRISVMRRPTISSMTIISPLPTSLPFSIRSTFSPAERSSRITESRSKLNSSRTKKRRRARWTAARKGKSQKRSNSEA